MLAVGIGHGQMEGTKLEDLMLAFMNGEFDVLVATTIIESGSRCAQCQYDFYKQCQ